MKNIFFVVALWAIVTGITGCEPLTEVSKKKEDPVTVKPETLPEANKGLSNATINGWIYANMNAYYLWGDKMPLKTATNVDLRPDQYFQSILYQFGVTDRFSWIEEDAEELKNSLQGVSKASGFSYTPFLAASNSKDVVFAVRYAIKGTPAERGGLKRGDIITKVNGVNIDTLNYRTILSPDVLNLTLEGASNSTITLTKEVIQNEPVHFSSIIEQGDKKVGYLVYNQFIPGIGTNGKQFDDQLRAIFGDFKAKGINELVLDLRFNGGGYISSSAVLSSLIVKGLKPGTLMNKAIWSINAKKLINAPESWYENNWLSEPNNLPNLSRVFVLVSGGTASASELVINNLKPYMEVILVGQNTYGKDVGSITLDDEENNYRFKWGLQPIVLRTVNSLGEANYGTANGFTPNYYVKDNRIPYLPFGDPNETLLKVALEKIGLSATPTARLAKTTTLPVLEGAGGMDNPRSNIKDMYIDRLK